MMKSEYEPRIGAEALRTLRGMVERDPDRIAKFSDSPQQLILRSPSQSTSIKVPPYVMIFPPYVMIFPLYVMIFPPYAKHIS